MSDRVTELLSVVETKHKEAAALLAKNEVPLPEDASQAEKLSAEINEICVQIDEYNASKKKAEDVKASLAKSNAYLREPQNRLGFSGDQKSDRWPAQGKGENLAPADRLADTGGFKSAGHFAYAIYAKGRDGRRNGATEQLEKWRAIQPEIAKKEVRELEDMGFKSPSGSFEDSDPDGGDLVPREFSNNIYTRMMEQNQIMSHLTVLPVMGNTLTVPALKEDSRVDGSRQGGLLAYWENEGDQYTKSKPTWRNLTCRLKKLTVLSFVTDELLADSPTALDSWMGVRVPMEFNFKINDAVVNGLGNGQPEGILSSGSKITAAAVSGQGTNTIVAANILAMFRRVIWSQRKGMIWLYNQDAEAQLTSLYQATGTTSGVLFFAPNTDMNGNLKFMNRPALALEQCQTLGTEGDLIAFAPDGYFAISKAGIQSFMSMHLRFDYDEQTFKWRFRFDGQPYDTSALTAYKGSTTYSSIVTLNSTRS